MKVEKKYDYHTINIPRPLVALIEEELKSSRYYYRNLPDFVIIAINEKIMRDSDSRKTSPRGGSR